MWAYFRAAWCVKRRRAGQPLHVVDGLLEEGPSNPQWCISFVFPAAISATARLDHVDVTHLLIKTNDPFFFLTAETASNLCTSATADVRRGPARCG